MDFVSKETFLILLGGHECLSVWWRLDNFEPPGFQAEGKWGCTERCDPPSEKRFDLD